MNSPFRPRGIGLLTKVRDPSPLVTLTGLTPDGEARPGATLGFTPAPGVTIVSQVWTTSLSTGGTGTTFEVPTEADGGTVTLVVTDSEDRTQTYTRNVRRGVPLATAQPTLTGLFQVGQTITLNRGTWTQSPTLTSQLFRVFDDLTTEDIVGATGLTYELTSADLDATINARVTATNTGGTTVVTAFGQRVTAAVAGPEMLQQSWSDETDTLAVTLSEPATIYLATWNDGDLAPQPSPTGFTGPSIAEAFTVGEATAGVQQFSAEYGEGSAGANRASWLAVNEAGGMSDVITVTFTPDFPAGAWAFSGSVVTSIPDAEPWAFSGSVVTAIPAGA